MLDNQPPDSGLEVEGRAAIANLRSHEASSLRSRGAVEERSQSSEDLAVPVQLTGASPLELGAQRYCSTPQAIARLTSACSDRDSAHVRVILSSIFGCAAVALRQPSGVGGKLVTRALEDRVQ